MHSEQEAHQAVPEISIDFPHKCILPFYTVAGNNVVPGYVFKELAYLSDIELVVSVGKKERVFCSRLEA